MMRNKFGRWTQLFLPRLAFVFLIAGCASRPQMPINYYTPQASNDNASIIGEDSLNSLIPVLFDNLTVYLESVDGLPVREARGTGKQALTIGSGRHRVRVVHQMGSFYGGTLLEFEAKSGRNYRAHAQQDLEGTNLFTRPLGGIGGPTFFWIEEMESGERVTEQTRAMVGTTNQSTPIPIFIPRGK